MAAEADRTHAAHGGIACAAVVASAVVGGIPSLARGTYHYRYAPVARTGVTAIATAMADGGLGADRAGKQKAGEGWTTGRAGADCAARVDACQVDTEAKEAAETLVLAVARFHPTPALDHRNHRDTRSPTMAGRNAAAAAAASARPASVDRGNTARAPADAEAGGACTRSLASQVMPAADRRPTDARGASAGAADAKSMGSRMRGALPAGVAYRARARVHACPDHPADLHPHLAEAPNSAALPNPRALGVVDVGAYAFPHMAGTHPLQCPVAPLHLPYPSPLAPSEIPDRLYDDHCASAVRLRSLALRQSRPGVAAPCWLDSRAPSARV